ncbi:DsrH/TusB family sulfur metabolism protein [Alteromonas sp. ASW11-130]|uniref:DsrH/TusB family sulfur metabolism protein n=1 Tax=Alteromonas sp. ASW11-130 TaxID=3015775 RepID=UPI002242ABD4|nr:DsrH/TusB family sulfur metabolism protein [Alteromonas sp. ASW11-130]MCW8092389.1 DsrH/TusB family sulfur relay protein [Alteromonas sp. ASW11-130]
MLYTIRHAQLVAWQKSILEKLTSNDCVIFAEDGVYCLREKVLSGNANVYAIKQDCVSRGIDTSKAELIDYDKWVTLSTIQQHWLNL